LAFNYLVNSNFPMHY